jgi:hypothetical protein
MAVFKVMRVCRCPNDVLLIEGTMDGAPVTARGWASALSNHFDAAAYGADGQRKAGATPRQMTSAEALGYARRLLEEQNAPSASESKPGVQDLGLADPA